ncbi:MAG: cytochrome c3 family protein [Geminicoccaceae bacterium]
MKPRLQNFDHRSSPYERPVQSWVCGRSATGRPCALGPDRKGACRTLAECRPRRGQDGWLCSRAKSAGGPCEEGPFADGTCCKSLPPCLPVRSLRARRGHFTTWATLVCLGLLLFLVGSRMNADLIDAGTVNAGHAEVEACGDCHVAFDSGPVGWFKAAFAKSSPAADNDKCLECHKWGQDALNAHTLPRPELADLIGKFEQTAETSPVPWTIQVSRAVFPVPLEAHNGDLACGACHKEHEGEASNLVEVTNARCQSCHQVTFPSFSQGHPSFGEYPYLRRTRIIFDHDSHNRKNFPEKKKQGVRPPETCDSCHAPDGTGQFMLTADFADTCARCHSEDIVGETVAGPKGTPVIAVPELDLETLQERGIAIGEWPETPLAFDISPYTKLLIAADPTIADDLVIIDQTDLQDLTDASDAELQSIARIAWAIKGLMFDLIISGMGVLEAHVEASLDNALDTDTVGRLVGHIPQDVIAAAGAAWFPNLKQEVVAYREATSDGPVTPAIQGDDAEDDLSGGDGSGSAANVQVQTQPEGAVVLTQAGTIEVQDLPPGSDPTAENEALGLPTLDPEEWAKAGGWYRKDYILYYRPVGHEDVVLRTWLDISAQSFGTPAERYGDALFQLLADKNTPGKCTKCHSTDQQPGGGLEINWSPFQPVVGESMFTTFVHATHFSAVGDDGCIACHRLNEDPNYHESYKGRDPSQFVANFAPMKREGCADCHVEQSAGDNCTMCHQYHIGEFATEGIPATRIDDLDKTKPDTPPVEGQEEAVDQDAEAQNTNQLDASEPAADPELTPIAATPDPVAGNAEDQDATPQQTLPATEGGSEQQ